MYKYYVGISADDLRMIGIMFKVRDNIDKDIFMIIIRHGWARWFALEVLS